VTIAGLVWIAIALVDGYLAYEQWTSAQLIRTLSVTDLGQQTLGLSGVTSGTAGNLELYAIVNAVVAGITLLFGCLLFVSPTRGRLDGSVAWGLLSVVGGVLQIATGTTHWAIFVGTAGAALAAILSRLAWREMADAKATPAVVRSE
jgi:hypothetical protein